MTLHTGRGLTQLADNCFIHTAKHVGFEVPVMLVGVIHRQNTRGRDIPPDCISGFETDFTPFAKGHIMALELGGWDGSPNIVPQYGMWQGLRTGQWRIMEVEMNESAAEAMVVQLDYDEVADTYAEQSRQFRSGKKLLDWTDPRIPVRFDVWGVPLAHVQPYLAADAAEKNRAVETGALRGHLPPPTKTFLIDAMPQVDRGYWRKQMILHRARDVYEGQKADATVASLGRGGGPIRNSDLRRAQLRAAVSPLGYSGARPSMPPFHKWIAQRAVREQIAHEFVNNTNNVAAGFTDFERRITDETAVEDAVFAH